MEQIAQFINETVRKHHSSNRDVMNSNKLNDDIGLDSLGTLALRDGVQENFEIIQDLTKLMVRKL